MPKGYVIFTEVVHDQEGMQAYARAAGEAMADGVRVLAVDRQPDVLEGEWPATQTVLLEFPSVDEARAWYTSDRYQAAAALRRAAADTDVVLLSGFEVPGA
jgi:uncharacterized protein (DUF1330 family)